MIVVKAPTPNPSHFADGVLGRGSWHVGAACRSCGPRADIRYTAEAERKSSSPSAPSGLRSLGWKGLFIDADLRATSPVGVRDREAEKRFIQLSGLEGSVLENRVFEEAYQIASVSTAKVLGMAASSGIPILEITSENLDAIETLPFDAEVRAEVLDAAQQGRRVTIPATPVTYLAWTVSTATDARPA